MATSKRKGRFEGRLRAPRPDKLIAKWGSYLSTGRKIAITVVATFAFFVLLWFFGSVVGPTLIIAPIVYATWNTGDRITPGEARWALTFAAVGAYYLIAGIAITMVFFLALLAAVGIIWIPAIAQNRGGGGMGHTFSLEGGFRFHKDTSKAARKGRARRRASTAVAMALLLVALLPAVDAKIPVEYSRTTGGGNNILTAATKAILQGVNQGFCVGATHDASLSPSSYAFALQSCPGSNAKPPTAGTAGTAPITSITGPKDQTVQKLAQAYDRATDLITKGFNPGCYDDLAKFGDATLQACKIDVRPPAEKLFQSSTLKGPTPTSAMDQVKSWSQFVSSPRPPSSTVTAPVQAMALVVKKIVIDALPVSGFETVRDGEAIDVPFSYSDGVIIAQSGKFKDPCTGEWKDTAVAKVDAKETSGKLVMKVPVQCRGTFEYKLDVQARGLASGQARTISELTNLAQVFNERREITGHFIVPAHAPVVGGIRPLQGSYTVTEQPSVVISVSSPDGAAAKNVDLLLIGGAVSGTAPVKGGEVVVPLEKFPKPGRYTITAKAMSAYSDKLLSNEVSTEIIITGDYVLHLQDAPKLSATEVEPATVVSFFATLYCQGAGAKYQAIVHWGVDANGDAIAPDTVKSPESCPATATEIKLGSKAFIAGVYNFWADVRVLDPEGKAVDEPWKTTSRATLTVLTSSGNAPAGGAAGIEPGSQTSGTDPNGTSAGDKAGTEVKNAGLGAGKAATDLWYNMTHGVGGAILLGSLVVGGLTLGFVFARQQGFLVRWGIYPGEAAVPAGSGFGAKLGKLKFWRKKSQPPPAPAPAPNITLNLGANEPDFDDFSTGAFRRKRSR